MLEVSCSYGYDLSRGANNAYKIRVNSIANFIEILLVKVAGIYSRK